MSFRKIANYTLIEPVGGGGSGSVYRAEEAMPEGVTREVAVKVLPTIPESDKKKRDAFVNEARALMSVSSHRSIVTVHNFGIEHGTPWIAMEYLPNKLEDKLGNDPMPADQVATLLRQLAEGLAQLHNQTPPILHNDMKPQNVLIDGSGDLKITDFGLASSSGAGNTLTIASVHYSAPELIDGARGKIGPASDLYSLGHIAYRAALGFRAYVRQFPSIYPEPDHATEDVSPQRWIAWHCSPDQQAPPIGQTLTGFDPTLSGIIARLTAKRIEDRYPDAQTLLADLQQISLQNHANPAPLPTTSLAAPPTPQRQAPSNQPSSYPVGVITDGDKKVSPLQRLWDESPVLVSVAVGVVVIALIAGAFLLTAQTKPRLGVEETWTADSAGVINIQGQIAKHTRKTQLFLEVDGQQLPCTITDGRFTADYKLDEPGQREAAIAVHHDGKVLGRIPLELVRKAPDTVTITFKTYPAVAQATITVRQDDGSTVMVKTNAAGVATLDVMYGDYLVKAEHNKYAANAIAGTTGDHSAVVELAMDGKYTLVSLSITPPSARVTFVAAQPVADVPDKREVRLDERGTARVELPTGQYRYLVQAAGYQTKQASLNALAAGETTVTHDLVELPPEEPAAPKFVSLDDLPSLDEIEAAALLGLTHEEFAEYLTRNVPLRQISFAVPLDSQPKVRAMGVVLSEVEKENLLNRMRNALQRLDTQEVRVDPAAVARLIQVHMRETMGVNQVKVREYLVEGTGAYALRIQYDKQDGVTKDKVRAAARQYVLDPQRITVVEY